MNNQDNTTAIPVGHSENDDMCEALHSVLSQVGDKWTILVVGVLSLRISRFNALQRAVPGISHRMLAHTLRGLERDGLVKRTASSEVPLRVEYKLTTLGQSLTEPLAYLAQWASTNRLCIESARVQFDELRRKNGNSDMPVRTVHHESMGPSEKHSRGIPT